MSARDTATIELEPARLAEWIDEGSAVQVQVVDVREPYEREAGHIAGSLHIPLSDLPTEAATLDRERPIVFYCRLGSRSLMAAQALRAADIEAYTLTGGLVRWADEGRPLMPEDGFVAEH
jgi:rhodanese-related sulfurtransferase